MLGREEEGICFLFWCSVWQHAWCCFEQSWGGNLKRSSTGTNLICSSAWHWRPSTVFGLRGFTFNRCSHALLTDCTHYSSIWNGGWMEKAMGAIGVSNGVWRVQLSCPDKVNFGVHCESVVANLSCMNTVWMYCAVDNPSRIYISTQ